LSFVYTLLVVAKLTHDEREGRAGEEGEDKEWGEIG
jgi:hypothetical protein